MLEKFHIITYGCQMNKCDSEVLSGILADSEYKYTDALEDADIVLLNTCSVRDTAESKVMGMLGRLKYIKEKRPDMIIGVCGCMAQSWGQTLIEKYPYVNIVLGTSRLPELPRLIKQLQELGQPAIDTLETPSDIDMPNPVRESSITAWVTIMHGCNNFCSYCIVPYVRGRERSRSSYSILNEVKSLGILGYKEVTLLGQNVNSYGIDKGDELDFAGLLELMDRESAGIERIRFTTSHPKDVPPNLIDAMASLPKVCEHFHLPAQAGSDKILARMNRGYTRQYYMDLVQKLREKVPGISITTDLIVGFPGETDEDFADTADLVQKVKFDVGFCFRYSPRRDTPAASMEDQVPEEIKMQRLYELLRIQDGISMAKNESILGTDQTLLVEGFNPRDKSQLTGRTRTNKIVFFTGSAELIGKLVNVTIIGAGNWSLRGEQQESKEMLLGKVDGEI